MALVVAGVEAATLRLGLVNGNPGVAVGQSKRTATTSVHRAGGSLVHDRAGRGAAVTAPSADDRESPSCSAALVNGRRLRLVPDRDETRHRPRSRAGSCSERAAVLVAELRKALLSAADQRCQATGLYCLDQMRADSATSRSAAAALSPASGSRPSLKARRSFTRGGGLPRLAPEDDSSAGELSCWDADGFLVGSRG
jgi:hypothetical protein